MRLLRPKTLFSTLAALLAAASLAVCILSLVIWAADDGVSGPLTYRVWDADGATYFLLPGAGRLTLVKQDVTRPPGETWRPVVRGLGNVQIVSGGQGVASIATTPMPRGWPPEWGRFHYQGPKMMFFAPPQGGGPHVCAISYSGVSLPLWAVALAAAAPPAGWLFSLLRKRRNRSARLRNGLCLDCGYDLRGSPGRCPECGSAAARDAAF